MNEQLVKDLTSKDEKTAYEAAFTIVNNSNAGAFQLLTEKSDFLFDFVKNNVNKRLEKAINKDNYRNLFSFLNSYSSDFEDTLMSAFAKYADEDLTDEMLNMLENGTDSQKTYSAKYFSYIPDTAAKDVLMGYSMSDNEALAYNAARSLSVMKAQEAYDNVIGLLDSEDEFTVLKAVKFLVAFGDKNAVEPLLKAMEKSSMSENIAGEIPYLESLLNILNTNRERAMLCFDNILSGLGEILPLSQIFCFEVYDVLSYLTSYNRQDNNSQAAAVLLKAYSKFETFSENDEYTFDEDKNTKQEISEIFNFLKGQDAGFWENQKSLVIQELDKTQGRIITALRMMCEYNIAQAEDKVKELLLNSDDEIVLCEALGTLKQMNKLDNIDKNTVLNRVHDENKKAIINNIF